MLGFEGDFSWAGLDAKSKTASAPSYMQSNIDAIATLRGRAGFATGGNLFYLTGGAAFLETRHRAIDRDGPDCNVTYSSCSDSWQTGFVAGAGYEAMLTSNLSFKAEYLYIGTSTQTLARPIEPDVAEGFADNVQIARVGLNYRLGGGSSGYMPLK